MQHTVPTKILSLRLKVKPITAGADATVNVWLCLQISGPETRHLPLQSCSHHNLLGFYAEQFMIYCQYRRCRYMKVPALSECWLEYCWHTWHRIFGGIFWQDSDSWCRYSWIVWNHAYMQLNLSTICSYMRIKRRSLDADMQQQFPYAAQNDFLTYKLGAAVSLYIQYCVR